MDKESKKEALSLTLRDIREEAELTQHEFAQQVSVHRTYISSLERGNQNPTVLVLWELAEALGKNPSEVLARAEQEYREL